MLFEIVRTPESCTVNVAGVTIVMNGRSLPRNQNGPISGIDGLTHQLRVANIWKRGAVTHARRFAISTGRDRTPNNESSVFKDTVLCSKRCHRSCVHAVEIDVAKSVVARRANPVPMRVDHVCSVADVT